MVICKICNKEMKMITNSHLRTHKLYPEEYIAQFPDAELNDAKMKQRYQETRYKADPERFKVCDHADCNNRVNHLQSNYCSYKCSMSHRMGIDWRHENKDRDPKRGGRWKDGWEFFDKKNKKLARERDNYVCQHCGADVKGPKQAHVHHMIPARCFERHEAEIAHDVNNLVTLCTTCHKFIEWDTLKKANELARKYDKLNENTAGYESFEEYKYRICFKHKLAKSQ